MCGISGFWQKDDCNTDDMQAIAEQMSNTLTHRGPDDAGTWVDGEVGIALAHRRLSIVDLSPQGHQPMISADGRYVVVFNGEIYNFIELRIELEQLGYKFRGHSDTEVMLTAFSHWGIEPAVQRFNGMFAFALWDRAERVLHLGRDRLGEKPLYYGWNNGNFLFASELKALKKHPHFQSSINRDALTLFLRYRYIPAPYSIYQGIYKLPPGTILTCKTIEKKTDPVPYWNLEQIALKGISQPFDGSESEALEQLESLLLDSVKKRMVADVPLGAFLSGGIDSSMVVALMQSQSSQAIKTFTIGFYEDHYNEADKAKRVAQHLGTDHTELYVTPTEVMGVIPKLSRIYDEPFADSSQIPTFLVSQLAKQQVTVSLSGDGGDELFHGYPRYFMTEKIWDKINWMPIDIRNRLSRSITGVSPTTWNEILHYLRPLLPRDLKSANLGDKLHKLADITNVINPQSLYRNIVSQWQNPDLVVIEGTEPLPDFNQLQQLVHLLGLPHYMMYIDFLGYLPDDILAKVDRATMQVSLEGRLPLLDHRFVEFVWHLPLSMKIQQGEGKGLLKQLLYKYVPRELLDRPKMGFCSPIDSWLRRPLRDWAESLLSENRLRQQGYLNSEAIHQKWQEHISGERNWQLLLWNVLMFQDWVNANQ